MTFQDFKLKPYLYKALNKINFIKPTPVQMAVIPKALNHENLVVESATGSGKTHAFIIPILQNLNELENKVQAVVIAPTRELATQLYNVFLEITKESPEKINIVKVIGGVDRDNEIKKFKQRQPQIVIGTMGRLIDLVNNTNVLKIHEAKMVVIDEADMIFDLKDLPDVDKLLSTIQDNPQFMVFSATISKGLRHFLNKYLENVKPVIIEEKNLTNANIEHLMVQCKAKNKKDVLLSLLKMLNPYLALIFVNTKENVEEVANLLAIEHFRVAKIHGDMEDRLRKQTLKRIASLEYQYVVASDIAARGIDILGVSHVINFDLPTDIEFYIHRTGRTARFDQTGYAYSLYAYEDDEYIQKLQAKGLKCQLVKIVNDELQVTSFTKAKPKSFNQMIEQQIHAKIKMPKKVKPGYRKKRNEAIKKKIKEAKKAHISEIYRQKARKEHQ